MNENISLAIKNLAEGKFVLVYDIDGREEEVDLVCLAEKVTPKHIYHLRHDAGGLICIAMHANIAEKLGLPFMAEIYSNVLEQYSIFNQIAPDIVAPYGDKPSFSVYETDSSSLNKSTPSFVLTQTVSSFPMTRPVTSPAMPSFSRYVFIFTPSCTATSRSLLPTQSRF